MNRRKNLKFLFAVGMSALTGAANAQNDGYPSFCSPRIDSTQRQIFLQKPNAPLFPALQKIYAATPFTLAGDPDHSDGRPDLFFFSHENLQAIVAAGKKHLFLEVPEEYQKVFDMLTDGSILPEQFRQKSPWLSKQMNLNISMATAEGIVFLGKNGVKVHATDTTNTESSDEDNEAYDDHIDNMIAFAREHCPERPSLHARIISAFKKVHGVQSPKAVEARDDDTARIKFILEKSKGEPSVIRMGADHFLNTPLSAKTLLGQRAVHVSFHSNSTPLANPDEPLNPLSQPDFIVLSENKRVYQAGALTIPGLIARKNQAALRP